MMHFVSAFPATLSFRIVLFARIPHLPAKHDPLLPDLCQPLSHSMGCFSWPKASAEGLNLMKTSCVRFFSEGEAASARPRWLPTHPCGVNDCWSSD